MDIQEITKRLYKINDDLLERTGKRTTYGGLYLDIRDDHCEVGLYTEYESEGVFHHGTAKGDTPEAALDDALAIIAALPSPETVKLHAHMARVADCIDKAHADGIADEYVTPLRVTVKAMSDNLLTVQAAE